jgi:hypothetical protein
MGWPKGKPRKGYVTKSGEAHRARGARLRESAPTRATPTNGRQEAPAQRQVEQVATGAWEVKPEWKPLLRWTGNTPPWTAFCPNCTFPEADGGYCPACGWSRPIELRQRT